MGATFRSTSFRRRSDDVRTVSTRIPRLRVEFQATRRDGTLAPSALQASNQLQADWLVSYRPSPGTVFFLGYGNTMREPEPLRFQNLDRTADAFFVKVSYLFTAVGGA